MHRDRESRPRLIRANSHLRNKWLAAITFLIIMAALLLLAIPSSQAYVAGLFSTNDSRTVFRLLIIFYSLFSIVAIMLITTGIHLIQAARKVHQSGHFPAPDMRVIRDTWVVSGSRATIISYFMICCGILFFIGGGSVPFFFHNLLINLVSPAG